MSGGSYNYLCHHTDDLSGRCGTVEEMAQRLSGLPYAAKAAADTRRVIALLADAQALAEQLTDVWHAIEWWDSNDYGEDQVQVAVAGYQGGDQGAAQAGQLDTSGYQPGSLTIPAEYLDGTFPLGVFFQGLTGRGQPTAAEAAYVAAWLGEPARDQRVESIPCPLPDCQAPAGSMYRTPYGPDYYLPSPLHHERHEALAAQILAEALADMREKLATDPAWQYVTPPKPIGEPPAAALTMADLTHLYTRLNPPGEQP